MAIGAGMLGVAGLVRAPTPPPPEVNRSKPLTSGRLEVTELGPIGGDRLLRVEAELRDPAPLFLPTPLNAAPELRVANLGASMQDNFTPFSPFLSYAEGPVNLRFPPVADVPARPEGELRVGERPNAYESLGRAPIEPVVLPDRLGYLEIVSAGEGPPVLRMELKGKPVAAEVPAGSWQPMELMAAIDSAGLVGSLTVVASSTAEEWDKFWRLYLAKDFRIGERLKAGLYRIRVGP